MFGSAHAPREVRIVSDHDLEHPCQTLRIGAILVQLDDSLGDGEPRRIARDVLDERFERGARAPRIALLGIERGKLQAQTCPHITTLRRSDGARENFRGFDLTMKRRADLQIAAA